ncbi:MAG: geranylgeranyl reductase family protein [Parafilimonas sp.]
MVTIKPVHKYDCDVLIAGGGPAGSALAFHLAKKGLKVIVAEAERFPRDKICGDGVSPIALAELEAMGIKKWKKFSLANEISKVGLFIKNDKVFIDLSKPEHLPFHARIIPRIELDNWIYETAKKAGAAYLEDTRLMNYVITSSDVIAQLKQGLSTKQIKAKVIVGADGSSSTVARQMQGGKHADEFQLLGLRSYYENVNGPTDRVDIYFTGDSFPGIYWMFPKGSSGANIGMAAVSATLPHKPSNIKNLLAGHLKNNEDIKARIGNGKMEGKIDGWILKFFNAQSTITSNRLLLVGDAAGLINPLSGDGIQYALLSARWASETLYTCFEKNDFSAAAIFNYRKKVDAELGYDFALSNLIVQFARNKTLMPVWMKILSVMISRAKEDKQYADTIAGIFEGTYPSQKALNANFILKSLLQGGKNIASKTIADLINNPVSAIENGLAFSQTTLAVLEEVKKYPREQGGWIMNTAGKTITVAGHVIKNIAKRN